MRIPVVDVRGVPLMPCTPPKASALLNAGKARPQRPTLGLFYVQLTYAQAPHKQRLVVGIEPGSQFEGFSVVGTRATVLNVLVEALTHVKHAVTTRRTVRRTRRSRVWRRPCRRPCRNHNRLRGQRRIPPSTRSRWEAKARIVRHLLTIVPLTEACSEDVHAETRPGKGGHGNAAFRPVQVGKEHLYHLITGMGLVPHHFLGVVTSQFRAQRGLTKTRHKHPQDFSSHAVDAWVLAARVRGAKAPTCTRLWYGVPTVLHRRQLTRLQAAKGGIFQPYGGRRSFGLKRGTVVRHPRYGRCTVGGYDREQQRISLHAYRTNTRLTQGAKPEECRRLTVVALRSWLLPHPQKGRSA